MTLLEQLGDIAKRGVELLEEAYAASSLPLPADQARTVRRTAAAFLSPTSHSRYQSRALAAARRNQHSLETLALIARRSRGTPRIANRLLRRVRDFAEVRGSGRLTQAVAAAALVKTQGPA